MRIEARTILWAAGVQAAPAAKWLQADKDRAGRVEVNADLSVPGDPDIFVIGDNAAVMQADGKPVPGVAPAAKQMGAYVARVDRRPHRRQAGAASRSATATTATSPPSAATPPSPTSAGSGSAAIRAWLLWGAAHIYFLIGFRNRLAVMLDWLWAYVTFQRGVRLITGPGSDS